MSTIDRAALIEQAARAQWKSVDDGGILGRVYLDDCDHLTGVALPVIAKALLAPLRELHAPIDAVEFSDGSIYPGSVRRSQVCVACGTDDGNWQRHPCPTVRLLDAIEAEVQP